MGIRLLKHNLSGAHLVVPYQDDIDTSSNPVLSTGPVQELTGIKSALLKEVKVGNLSKDDYRLDIINDAMWISNEFQTKVLIAYFDDEGRDNVSIADCGKIERVSICGSSIEDESEIFNEIELVATEVVRSKRVERKYWNDNFEREFKSLFGHPAPDLTDFSFSEFEVVESEAPKPSASFKFYSRHRKAINIFLLPVTLSCLFLILLKEKKSLKYLVIAALLIAAMLTNKLLGPSEPDRTKFDEKKPRQSVESLCGDKSNVALEDFCERYNEIKQKADTNPLESYEASEWEPSWSLTLTGGTLIQFRQLDPEMGADFITDSYKVTTQIKLADGWSVEGEGEKGTLTFTTSDISAKGGCTHSASGYTHRDRVIVHSPQKEWRGCGGPEI